MTDGRVIECHISNRCGRDCNGVGRGGLNRNGPAPASFRVHPIPSPAPEGPTGDPRVKIPPWPRPRLNSGPRSRELAAVGDSRERAVAGDGALGGIARVDPVPETFPHEDPAPVTTAGGGCGGSGLATTVDGGGGGSGAPMAGGADLANDGGSLRFGELGIKSSKNYSLYARILIRDEIPRGFRAAGNHQIALRDDKS
uniref:OSJNBa0027H09.5 protein n=1 Tax=Oryza sativa subsp. japonica TaxID=39947 RepID=Q7XP34_ORYSJ|nr:OSJNBa0027H09.5 [Oryza sativa Japonica Group]